MALQLLTQAPRLLKAVGEYTELACGIAGGSGTTTTLTIPQFAQVHGVVGISTTTSTAPYCDTTSGNTATITHGNAEKFFWIAWGKAKI